MYVWEEVNIGPTVSFMSVKDSIQNGLKDEKDETKDPQPSNSLLITLLKILLQELFKYQTVSECLSNSVSA